MTLTSLYWREVVFSEILPFRMQLDITARMCELNGVKKKNLNYFKILVNRKYFLLSKFWKQLIVQGYNR